MLPRHSSVTVEDNESNPASDSDSKTVTVTDVLPTVDLTKTVTPATLPEPGGVFTFTLTITNTSIENVTITSLGDSNGVTSECSALIGTTLAVGASTSCTYTVTHTEAGSYDNTAFVYVEDNEGNPASDSDSKTVTVTDVLPTVDLVKDVTPDTLAEPGGAFHFTLTITNTSVENVTITALSDDNPLPAACTDLIGDVLAPAQSVSCEYDVTHTEAGSYSNTASVTVADNEGNPASDSDSKTVTVTDVLPTVDLTKTVTPSTLPEPGGVFHFTLTITNTSVENVTITGLGDSNVLSPTGTPECLALVHTILTPGQSVSCSYDVTHTEAGTYPNTADVTVADNEGNSASDSDSETVIVTDVLPMVDLTKTVTPSTLPEPGGVFTFTLTITNTSVENVTITGLGDSNVLSPTGTPECLALVHTILTPGQTVSCNYNVTHTEAGTYLNTADVTVADNEGNPAGNSASATVTVTDVKPVITLTKTAAPATLAEPGGAFTYTYTIHNGSVEAVKLTKVTDDVLGTLYEWKAGDPVITIAAGADYLLPGTFTKTYTEAGSYTNIAWAYAVDNENNEAKDDDTKTVNVTDVLPVITLTKTAAPATRAEPGGAFTYTYTVHNGSVEAVKLTKVTDDILGTLYEWKAGDLVITIEAGADYLLPGTFTKTYAEAGSYTNIAWAYAVDNENNEAKDDDTKTVTVTDVMPTITVTKTADPTSVPETGGNVTFTFVVTNKSVEAVTITSLSDTVFGPLAGDNDCKVDTVLPVNGSCTFSEVHFIKGDFESGTNHKNVFTAHAQDNEKNDTSASDDATVDFTNVTADIAINKVTVDNTTSGDGLNILTGESIKWRYTVTNVGNYPLSNLSVTDSETGVTPVFVSGDTNSNGKLDLTETWIYEASGTAITGNYSNTGTAYGDFTDGAGNVESDTATDGSSYFGADPQISIVKVTVDGSYIRRRWQHPDRRVDQMALHSHECRQRAIEQCVCY